MKAVNDEELASLVTAATYIRLAPPRETSIVPAIRYVDDADALRAAFVPIGIKERAGGRGLEDIRADASHWLRYYAAAVATLPLMALAAGVEVDASAEKCDVVIQDGVPTRIHAEVRGASDREAIRPTVRRRLLVDHLTRVVDHILRLVKLDPRVLWSDVGESIDCLYEAASGRVDPAIADAISTDRGLIFRSETLAGIDGPNPLRGTIWYETARPDICPAPVQVREMCCIVFHVRTPPTYCRNCPLLTTTERATMVARWRREVAASVAPVT